MRVLPRVTRLELPDWRRRRNPPTTGFGRKTGSSPIALECDECELVTRFPWYDPSKKYLLADQMLNLAPGWLAEATWRPVSKHVQLVGAAPVAASLCGHHAVFAFQ